MKALTVGMAELAVTNLPDSVLVTHALGSCVAVLLHDPIRRAAGMIHYMLPLSSITPDQARERPAMFGDTGIPLLFERMYALGCRKPDIVVRVVGGASVTEGNEMFEIGRRNYMIARQLFIKSGIRIAAEAVGGDIPRTVRLFVDTGRATIRRADYWQDVDF